MAATSSRGAGGTTEWGQGLQPETTSELLSYQSQVTITVPATATAAATTRTTIVRCTVAMSKVHLDSWGNEVLFKHKGETLDSATAAGVIPRLAHPLPRYFGALGNTPLAMQFVNIPVDSYKDLCAQLAASQKRRAAERARLTASPAAKKAAATDDKVVTAAAELLKELGGADLLPSCNAEASQGQAEEALKALYSELMDTLTRSYNTSHRQRTYLQTVRDTLSQPCKSADTFYELGREWERTHGTPSSSSMSAEDKLTLSEGNPFKPLIAACLGSVDRVFAKAHLLGVLQYKHGPLAHAVADELLDMRGPLHKAGHALESLLVSKSSSSSSENNPTRIKDALRKAAARLLRERNALRGSGFKLKILPFESGNKPELTAGAIASAADCDEESSDSDGDASEAVTVAAGAAGKRKRSIAQIQAEQKKLSREYNAAKASSASSTPSKKRKRGARGKKKKVAFKPQ